MCCVRSYLKRRQYYRKLESINNLQGKFLNSFADLFGTNIFYNNVTQFYLNILTNIFIEEKCKNR